MQRYCLALDLIDDRDLITEYIEFHKNVWQEIQKSIKDSGVINLEIYNIGDRLFMIMETNSNFSFEEKARLDSSNPKVQEWENLMWKFQKVLPQAKSGEKWMLMDKIFELK